MPKTYVTKENFIAPAPTRWVQNISRTLLPLLMSREGLVGVEYREEDLECLRALDNRRVLLTPNHPTITEPFVLFHLSCQVNHYFHYLACREAFDEIGGLQGEFFRRVGVYSVVRGTTDRASYRATRELLKTPGMKLVAFPEGEIYSQNDTLLPFHSGLFQIAFWALEDLHDQAEARRASGSQADDDGALFILPVAIKYRFTEDMTAALNASLDRLEPFVGVPVAERGVSLYDRLRRVGVAMLTSYEKAYGLSVPADADPADLTPRLNAVREAILQRIMAAAGIGSLKGETLPERLRALIHAIEVVTRDDDDPMITPYDGLLHTQRRAHGMSLLADLERLANWIAVHDGYVRADPTPERMGDTLIRLERECFGKVFLHGPRRATLHLAEPLNLADYWDAYHASKRTTLQTVTHEIENRVAETLNGC